MKKGDGVFTGTTDIYMAMMTTPETATEAPMYDDPIVLCKSVEVSLGPSYKEGSLYASNARVRNAKRIDFYEGELTGDQISQANIAKILGRKIDTSGVQVIDGYAEAPYVAIGLGFTKDNGAMELWWLPRCKFAEQEVDRQSENDSIEYQTPKLSFTADRLMSSNHLAYVVDSDDEAVSKATVEGWFKKVFAPAAAATEG